MKALVAALVIALVGTTALATGPRFTAKPVAGAVEERDASGVRPIVVTHGLDLWDALRQQGDRTARPAMNIDALGEVPDSSWFTNRLARMSHAEIVTGPDSMPDGPHGPWTVIGGKIDGITPGLRVKDSSGHLFFVKFDPPTNPEMASGAEVIATKLLYALGYNVPENYIATIRRSEVTIDPGATLKSGGHSRRLTERDLDRLLRGVARNRDGSYRVLASLRLPGDILGPFRYAGTRVDDPNDTVPHEHRRELRGLRVFAAWLNHVDAKSQNTLDTLVHVDSRAIVRHHLIDFGSALGSAATGPKAPRDGHLFLFDRRHALLSLATLGAYRPAALRGRNPKLPSVGRIEAVRFRPEAWKPTLPNPAFENAQPDDVFWAAQRVMAFDDETIRAVVATAKFSDPAAASYLAETLIARRNAVGRSFLTAVNPVIAPAIDAGRLTFRNVATDHAVAEAPAAYHVRWFVFDNNTSTATALTPWLTQGDMESAVPPVPAHVEFVAADIAAAHERFASWAMPVRAFFHREQDGTWTLVAIDRGHAGK